MRDMTSTICREINVADKTPPTPELLRKLLRYEAETGKLFWRARPAEMFTSRSYADRWNARWAGNEAFKSINGSGYPTGAIFDVTYLAHRVIWAMVHGEWPADQIDHINGDRADNRLANLRAVSCAENLRNQKRRVTNTSGVTGVYWDKMTGKWRAWIAHKGRSYHLGLFADFSDACFARAAAEAQYGFHKNHGRSALRTKNP